MDNRCFHELKTSGVATVAEKMERDENSMSITETELGKSVLSLREVLQTFDHESAMFNLKVIVDGEETEYRTVILTKNKAEIDGKNKVIVIIRDITDKVRLKQEQIKKNKGKKKISELLTSLDDVFK
jgi:C4-type Zn-finger protein